MRYYLHIAIGREIDFDDEGEQFLDVAAARAQAVTCFHAYYLAPSEPKLRLLRQAVIWIADSTGKVHDRVTFVDAFRTANGQPIVSATAGFV
jgi:hypothetical protein